MRGETESLLKTNEIRLSGVLDYCSGRYSKKGSAIGSEEIEKDAIKGDLICFEDCSTYAIVVRVKT